MKHLNLGGWSVTPQTFGPPVVMGDESIMSPKANGTAAQPVQEDLRWGCDASLADDICHFNRQSAERRGYWETTTLPKEAANAAFIRFHDSNSGNVLFTVPSKPGRTLKAFLRESKDHGWPSFRDHEVCWKWVRVLPGGEVVSVGGSHLGHNIPDYGGNRYCINLVSVAGRPRRLGWVPCLAPSPARHRRQRSPPASVEHHYVLTGNRARPPFPEFTSSCAFAAGCFWGVEKAFWRLPGVYSTAAGFSGGLAEAVDPSYLYVCTGESGHAEAVQVVWDPKRVSFADLLRLFWACHDPTQGHAQGKDVGSQYRSAIFCTDAAQAAAAQASRSAFAAALRAAGYGEVTTDVQVGCPFYRADDAHQQYLARPDSRKYCSAEPSGVPLPEFEAWHWTECSTANKAVEAARQRLGPVLPESFWETYDISIDAPDEPAGIDPEEQAIALRAQQRRRASRETSLKEVTAHSVVVIEHCASCGYSRRAVELAAFLGTVCGSGKFIGMVPDAAAGTGRFEVGVIAQETSGTRLVHSKSGGNGFVDTVEKLVAVLEALEEAQPGYVKLSGPEGIARGARNFPGLRSRLAPRAVPPAEAGPPVPPPSAAPARLLRVC